LPPLVLPLALPLPLLVLPLALITTRLVLDKTRRLAVVELVQLFLRGLLATTTPVWLICRLRQLAEVRLMQFVMQPMLKRLLDPSSLRPHWVYLLVPLPALLAFTLGLKRGGCTTSKKRQKLPPLVLQHLKAVPAISGSRCVRRTKKSWLLSVGVRKRKQKRNRPLVKLMLKGSARPVEFKDLLLTRLICDSVICRNGWA
jgi:hypothetical protein